MKKVISGMLAALIAALLVTGMAGCGGNKPESLAKQVIELTREGIKLEKEGVQENDPKYAAFIKKAEALNKKIEQLSVEDQKAVEELASEEVLKLLMGMDE